ncbi:hypothetical protein Pla52n_24830 [Stieleria varia]|uniref:Uncharacterized protein n=1 Tax=Stieleria varia TaxID=2528005 RepID=A0A5C6AZ87_9BACT|nr:hypothetical protein Pla52n_24830 [Stieleria varia]
MVNGMLVRIEARLLRTIWTLLTMLQGGVFLIHAGRDVLTNGKMATSLALLMANLPRVRILRMTFRRPVPARSVCKKHWTRW